MSRADHHRIQYAIYSRQSTDTMADFSSCDAQFAVCGDFAKATGEPNLSWCGQRFDEARRVRAIFKRAAAGQTPDEIARRIDHLGWRTKQWVSRRSSNVVGGGRWTARRVLAVLRNPVYIGWFADMAATRSGSHATIVPPDSFHLAQDLLDKRRSGRRGARHQHGFSLRGKINCPKCRRPLATYTIDRRRGEPAATVYRYYRCRSTRGGRLPCRGVQYPAGEVERFVRDLLTQPETWRQYLDHGPTPWHDQADALRAVWYGLDILSQDRPVPQIVDQVEFRSRNSVARVTLNPRLAEIIPCQKSAT